MDTPGKEGACGWAPGRERGQVTLGASAAAQACLRLGGRVGSSRGCLWTTGEGSAFSWPKGRCAASLTENWGGMTGSEGSPQWERQGPPEGSAAQSVGCQLPATPPGPQGHAALAGLGTPPPGRQAGWLSEALRGRLRLPQSHTQPQGCHWARLGRGRGSPFEPKR